MSQITELLNRATIRDLEDGTTEHQALRKVTDNRCGAYARVTRPEQTLTSFACAGSENNYYPGNMVLVDGSFLTSDPTIIPFREAERKPLNYSLSAGAYLPINEDIFNNVIPTERNVNKARNKFAYLYGRECAERKRSLGDNVELSEASYSSGASLNVGGTIKGTDFGIDGSTGNRRTKVFILKQALYTLSLDNTYRNGDDFFTDQLKIADLERAVTVGSKVGSVGSKVGSAGSKLGSLGKRVGSLGTIDLPGRKKGGSPVQSTVLPLGVIQDVKYGRMAIITVSSKDESSLGASISKLLKLDLKGGSKSCDVKIKIIGGNIGGYSDGSDVSGEDAANKIISYLYTHPIEAADIETAKPIEYSVSYLKDMRKMVTAKILPYAQVYVEKVLIKFIEHNSGASFKVKFTALDVKPNDQGKPDYVEVSTYPGYDEGLEVEVSPRALCLVFEMRIKLAEDKYDRNLYCPRIPLEKMEPENDGSWCFRLKVNGTVYTINDYSFSPTVENWQECDKWTYLPIVFNHDKRYYSGQSEEYILAVYNSWAEKL